MKEPELTDKQTNFIEDEMVLVKSPLISREAASQYQDKSLK